MSEMILRRWPDLVVRWALIGGVAIAIGWLAVSPPRAARKGQADCQLSGSVTCQGRPVARGMLYLSCMIVADPPYS